MAFKAEQRLPGELTSERRLRESIEGGPGSGPRGGKGKSPYGKKPSQLDALRGDRPPKTLKDHVKRLADEVSDGPGDDFKDKLRVAMSQARSEGNSRAIAAIQHLRNADDYNSKGLQRGSDRMMDKADAMYDKGISMLRKSV
jgi:hypothetical protein